MVKIMVVTLNLGHPVYSTVFETLTFKKLHFYMKEWEAPKLKQIEIEQNCFHVPL